MKLIKSRFFDTESAAGSPVHTNHTAEPIRWKKSRPPFLEGHRILLSPWKPRTRRPSGSFQSRRLRCCGGEIEIARRPGGRVERAAKKLVEKVDEKTQRPRFFEMRDDWKKNSLVFVERRHNFYSRFWSARISFYFPSGREIERTH